MKKLTKILTTLTLCLCLIFTGAIMVSCKDNSDKDKARLKSVSDVYGFAGMSAGTLLTENKVEEVNTFLKPAQSGSQLDVLTEGYNNVANVLNKYIEVFEGVVGGTNPVSSEIVDSDKNEYKTKIVATKTNLLSETVTCEMYFNEKTLNNTEVLNPNDKSFKVATTLEGIVVFTNAEGYIIEMQLSGKKTVENDGEVDVEITLTKGSVNVKFNMETENNEQEFGFKIYLSEQLIQEFEFDLESVQDKIKLELTTEILGVENEFEVEQVFVNSEKHLKIKYEVLETEILVDVKVERQGENTIYTYLFPGNIEITKIK